MNIDFIIGKLSGGGAEKVMVTLANGFSSDYNVSLITFKESNAFELNSTVNRIKLHNGKIKNHTAKSWLNLFKYYIKKTNRPDIIIVFMPVNALITIPIAKLFGIKVIVSEHNNHKANPSFRSKYVRKILYPLINAITILTSYDYDFYKKLNKNVVILPNPINSPKEVSDIKNRQKNILAAGSLIRYDVKGFDTLLKISAPILLKNKDWTLTIAGSGENGMKLLKDISKELNIENQVKFPGFCKDIQGIMQNSQIFVLPSKYEGLPMVLMEALSNGMACVAYDCISGPSDLIKTNMNGLLVENQNKMEFQRVLNSLIQDNALRYSIASQGPNSMLKYDLLEILKRWESLFKKINI